MLTIDLQLLLKLMFLKTTMVRSLKTASRKKVDQDMTRDTDSLELIHTSVFTDQRNSCVYDVMLLDMASCYTKMKEELRRGPTGIKQIDDEWDPTRQNMRNNYMLEMDKKTLCDFLDLPPSYYSAVGCMDEVDFWARIVAPNCAFTFECKDIAVNGGELLKRILKRSSAIVRQIKLILTAVDCRTKIKFHEKHRREENPCQLLLCL